MKNQITKFDLEAAFKALDEIDIPAVSGIRESRQSKENLNENLHSTSLKKTESLLEDYYDINNVDELNAAADEREAEIAQAKLDKIERIVDLDAKTPEDLQPSYVGKTIIQCPQCMTLFYKDPADIVVSEDDPSMVNVTEVCQHCGNDSGYTIIGKVAADEPITNDVPSETPVEEVPTEEPTMEEVPVEEVPTEEVSEETGEEDVSDLAPVEELPEEEPKEEAFKAPVGSTLTEQIANALVEDYADEIDTPVEETEETKEVEEIEPIDAIKNNLDIHGEDGVITVAEKGKLDDEEAPKIEVEVTEPEFDALEKEFHEEKPAEETPVDEPVEESLNKSEIQEPVEKHECSDNDSEHLTINEAVDKELDKKLKDHNDYITYIQNQISYEENALKNTKNDEVKAAIERRLDALKADLEAALPEAIKEAPVEEEPIEVSNEASAEDLPAPEETSDPDMTDNIEESIEPGKEVGIDESLNKSEVQEPVEKHECSDNDSKNRTVNEGIKDKLSNLFTKIVAYIDCSGSNGFGDRIGKQIEKAKKLGATEFYYFSNIISSDIDTIKANGNGSGNYNAVLDHINKHNFKKVLVLTDDDINWSNNGFGGLTLKNDPRVTVIDIKGLFDESLINKNAEEYVDHLTTENRTVNEGSNELVYSEEAVNKMLDSKEFEKPISDAEVQGILDDNANLESYEEVDECALRDCLTESLTNVYENVESFDVKSCSVEDNKFIVEGIIKFNSGTRKETKYIFTEAKKVENGIKLSGINESLSEQGSFILNCLVEDTKIIPETVAYRYTINESIVEGCTEKKTNLEEAGFLGHTGRVLDDIVKDNPDLNHVKYIIRSFTRDENGNFKPKESKTATEYNKAEDYAKKISTQSDVSYVKIYLAMFNDQKFNPGPDSTAVNANKNLEVSRFIKGKEAENNIDQIKKAIKNTTKADQSVQDTNNHIDNVTVTTGKETGTTPEKPKHDMTVQNAAKKANATILSVLNKVGINADSLYITDKDGKKKLDADKMKELRSLLAAK